MVFGTDLYGGIDKVGETAIKTKFFHIDTINSVIGLILIQLKSESKINNLNSNIKDIDNCIKKLINDFVYEEKS